MSVMLKAQSLLRPALLGLGIVFLASGFTSPASAGVGGASFSACQAFPEVGLWQNLTHATVRSQVESEYSGDWQVYISRLENYGNQLRRIRASGKSARVTRGGKKVRLQGEAIARFLTHVDKRIAVTRCLAKNEGNHQSEGLDVASIAEFSTAAGGTDDDRPVISSVSKNKCPAFPRVAWWTFKSHDRVADYVNRKHKGNWAPYIKKWNGRLKSLQDIYSRDSSAVTKTGNTLKGPSLAAYIKKMQDRIDVTRCLANNAGAART